jgi:hypothetical protein
VRTEAPLHEVVRSRMTCPTCGGRRVTHERLALASGCSLRTVVRFLQGQPTNELTQNKMVTWLLTQPER